MAKLHNMVPILPSGVSVVDRTSELELMQRSQSKYNPLVETLKVIDTTKCVMMDIGGYSKLKINSIKMGVKNAAKKMGYKPSVKFAIKDNLLYIWSNR